MYLCMYLCMYVCMYLLLTQYHAILVHQLTCFNNASILPLLLLRSGHTTLYQVERLQRYGGSYGILGAAQLDDLACGSEGMDDCNVCMYVCMYVRMYVCIYDVGRSSRAEQQGTKYIMIILLKHLL